MKLSTQNNTFRDGEVDTTLARTIAGRHVPLASIAAVAAISLTLSAPAEAATIFVTSNADSPGLGCTLREAVEAINSGGATMADCLNSSINPFGTFDEVDLNTRSGVITLNGTHVTIEKPVFIDGPGAEKLTINGNQASRIFRVNQLTPTEISGLTLTNGLGTNGGAIYSQSNLVLDGLVVSANTATSNGGGVAVSGGDLTMIRTTVWGNAMTDPGGFGGGVSAAGGGNTVELIKSTVADNLSANGAGGVWLNGGGSTLTLKNSTVSGNSGATSGGIGILGQNSPNFANVTLINSTVSGNSANNGTGGIVAGNGNVTLHNSTLANNSSVTGFHGIAFTGGALVLNNSLIDQPLSACNAVANTLTTSLASHASCTGTATASSALKLGPLKDNGGATQTHALLPGSVAIDTGNNGTCELEDQREAARPLDGDNSGSAICDIGAFERVNMTAAAASCAATALPCPAHPGTADLKLKSGTTGVAGSIALKNATVDAEEISSPASSPYRVCLYQDGNFIGEWATSAGEPGFVVKNGSLSYKSRVNDLTKLLIKPGVGKGQIAAGVRNGPAMPLHVITGITAQFVNDSACWTHTWTPGHIKKDDSKVFQAQDK